MEHPPTKKRVGNMFEFKSRKVEVKLSVETKEEKIERNFFTRTWSSVVNHFTRDKRWYNIRTERGYIHE